ncbi:Lsr2 family protein [Nocardioides caeni]|uniref:Lsr2 family protein n=1 Tax=Nocardioides caeni TaxID=574700 RepID=A0A4S8NAI6_9ACTN|nr:Lsr2 family protein [Nocardioides caeni]THV12941.1 Lsr2 family protein [Nocardioides caeni]
MAQRVNIVLVDDIDGSEATETVTFGLDGANYEIDLNDAHAAALRDALATYVGHGRKVSRGGAKRAKSGSSVSSGASASDVRAWARENGYDVPARGRIPADVRQAFDAAQ